MSVTLTLKAKSDFKLSLKVIVKIASMLADGQSCKFKSLSLASCGKLEETRSKLDYCGVHSLV